MEYLLPPSFLLIHSLVFRLILLLSIILQPLTLILPFPIPRSHTIPGLILFHIHAPSSCLTESLLLLFPLHRFLHLLFLLLTSSFFSISLHPPLLLLLSSHLSFSFSPIPPSFLLSFQFTFPLSLLLLLLSSSFPPSPISPSLSLSFL